MDERVDEMMAELSCCLDGLAGAERSMTEEMLRTFCWYSVKTDDLMAAIEHEGILIETARGPKPNPANQVLHQYTQRKGDCYQKVLKSVAKSGSAAVDKIAQFVR